YSMAIALGVMWVVIMGPPPLPDRLAPSPGVAQPRSRARAWYLDADALPNDVRVVDYDGDVHARLITDSRRPTTRDCPKKASPQLSLRRGKTASPESTLAKSSDRTSDRK